MLTLNNLPALVKKRKRVGRGGKLGGTSGKGHKGQKARTGGASKVRSTFEGGQTPLCRRLPKRGFSNIVFAQTTVIVNLSSLENSFDEGAVVDVSSLHAQGIIKSRGNFVIKILGKGTLSKKFNVHAHRFSASAQAAIEKVGGSCTVLEGAK